MKTTIFSLLFVMMVSIPAYSQTPQAPGKPSPVPITPVKKPDFPVTPVAPAVTPSPQCQTVVVVRRGFHPLRGLLRLICHL